MFTALIPKLNLTGLLTALALVWPVFTQAATATASEKWEKDIQAFEAMDRTNAPPKGAILFIGSSSIRLWKSLADDFPGLKTINRGFGGSELADSVHFANRIVFPYQPRLIVVYAGGNDINAGKSPEDVFADFKEFSRLVATQLPRTRIAYISVAPNPARWSQVDRVRKANQLISEHVKSDARLSFIDVFSHMLGKDGQPLPDIFVEDRLHMNPKGYALWTKLVGPHLK